jgi:hypothetical protein
MSDLASIAENLAKTGVTPQSSGSADRKSPPPRNKQKTDPPKDTAAEGDSGADADKNTTAEGAEDGGDTRNSADVVHRPMGGELATTKAAAKAVVEAMGDRQTAGDLVQVRVQPPELGGWMNELLDSVAFAFNVRRGDVAGAVFGLVRGHFDEFVAVMEAWTGGPPTDRARLGVWRLLQQDEAERVPTVIDGQGE